MLGVKLIRTVTPHYAARMRLGRSMPGRAQSERVCRPVRSGRILLFAVFWLVAAAAGLIPRVVHAKRESVFNVPATVSGPQLVKLNARRKVLFRQMMKEPTDMKAALQYAKLSTKVGDLEAAISTLDRLVIFAPTLPRLKLDLGALYFRLGSFRQAELEFQRVLNSKARASEALKRKARRYLVAARRSASGKRILSVSKK